MFKAMSLFYLFVLYLLHSTHGTETFDEEGKFLYFAYGSNLLKRRLHINNPTAEFYSIAWLPGYRLDFNIHSNYWNGAVATIAEDSYSHVWGALWTLNLTDMSSLDKQEEIHTGMYYATNVTIIAPGGKVMTARTYIETVDPPKVPVDEIPPERQPSDTYKEVIVYGAFECRLRLDYIKYLLSFPTNGKQAGSQTRADLGYPFNTTWFY